MSESIAKTIIQSVLAAGRDRLSEHEAKQVLAAYGIPTTKEALVRTEEELQKALPSFQFPVVLKIDSPDILHKTEAGLVHLNVKTLAEAETSFWNLLRRAREYNADAVINGVLVQEMVTKCTECFIGVKRDEQFGPTILFGLGGIFVEVFGDVALRVAPITAADAAEMVRETKGYKILAGARGQRKADIPAIEDALIKASIMAVDLEHYLTEVDINPLMVGEEGFSVKAADALMLLQPPK